MEWHDENELARRLDVVEAVLNLADSIDGGTPGNWTTPSTSATYKVGKTAYVGDRYWSCRVYATDGTVTSNTVASATSADGGTSLTAVRANTSASLSLTERRASRWTSYLNTQYGCLK